MFRSLHSLFNRLLVFFIPACRWHRYRQYNKAIDIMMHTCTCFVRTCTYELYEQRQGQNKLFTNKILTRIKSFRGKNMQNFRLHSLMMILYRLPHMSDIEISKNRTVYWNAKMRKYSACLLCSLVIIYEISQVSSLLIKAISRVLRIEAPVLSTNTYVCDV